MLVIAVKLVLVLMLFFLSTCLIGIGFKRYLNNINFAVCMALGAGVNVCLIAIIATVLGVFGIFHLSSFGIIYLLSMIVTGVWIRPLEVIKEADLHIGREILSIDKALVVIAVIAAVLYFSFPTYYMWGGRDYGLYLINGIHTAETGSVLYESDEYINEHYEELEDVVRLWYPALFSSYEDGISEVPGDINAQFLPMYWSLLSLGYLLFGMGGLGRTTAFITIIALCLFYSFVKNIFDKKVAVLASLLLTLCPAQIWGARITQSEQMAQLVMFLFFYLFYLGWKNNNDRMVLFSVTVAGFGCFCRLDNYIIGLGICAIAVYVLLFVRKSYKVAIKTALIWTGWVLISLASGFYFHYHYYVEHWQKNVLKYIVIANIAAIIFVALLYLLRNKIWALIEQDCYLKNAERIRRCVIGLLTLGAVFLYFVRPILQPESYVASALRQYCWYICPLTLIFALAGIAVFWKKCNVDQNIGDFEAVMPFLFIGMGLVMVYSVKPSITMDHYWMSRRWLPICFPFLIAFGMYGMQELCRKFVKLEIFVSVLCCAVVFGYIGYRDKDIWNYQSYQGMEEDYEETVAMIPEDAVIFTNNEGCASVLKYLYHKSVYLLKEDYDEVQLYQFISRYPNIYYMGEFYGGNLAWGINFDNCYRGIVGGVAPESSYLKYPEEKVEYSRTVDLYHLEPLESQDEINLTSVMFVLGDSQLSDDGIEMNESGICFYGPYFSIDKGSYAAHVEFSKGDADGVLEAVVDEEPVAMLEVPENADSVDINFEIERDSSIVQIRYTKENEGYLRCDSVVLQRR